MIPYGDGVVVPPASYPGIPKLPSSGNPVPTYTNTSPSFVPPHIPADYVPPSGGMNDYSNVPPAGYVPAGGTGYGATGLGGTTMTTTTTGGSGPTTQEKTIFLLVALGVLAYFVFFK